MSTHEQVVQTEVDESYITTNVETEYNHGKIRYIRVTVRYEKVEVATDSSTNISGERTLANHTGVVEFANDDGVATLHGFYPKTNATGEQLYRDCLETLRLLDAAASVVGEHTPDTVTVAPPQQRINQVLTE